MGESPLITALGTATIATIHACLRAVADGPFFPDWEFETLMGVDRETVRRVVSDWPQCKVSRMDFQCAVQNGLNNLVGYPHGCDDVWAEYIPVSSADVRAVLVDLIAKKVLQ